MTANDFYGWVTQGIVTVGISILSFVAITSTRMGEKFLSHHLDKRIADFKHDQTKEIEELKTKLSHIEDRGKRSNEEEYKALTTVWEKFVDAFLSTQRTVHNFIQYPDFTRLSEDEIKSYLDFNGIE